MIIRETEKQKKKARFGRILSRRNVLLVLLLIAALAIWKLDRFAKSKGFTGAYDFSSTVIGNYLASRKAEPDHIEITIGDKDIRTLEAKRQQALERGVIVNELDGEFVSAKLKYKGEEMKVKLRLKGHMTDHLQDQKWSFRIKMKGKDSFMGMKRFSIQHPGTRGYVYEWIYHELMKREGIIALHYSFVNVSVNGKDWGIYAVEENFDEQLITSNGREPGPIVRFDPDMYWKNRFSEMQGRTFDDEFARYYSAPVQAYREDKVLADTTQRQAFLRTMAMIESVRSRQLPVSAVFDVDKLAKFHALIDLVGGEHSIDWSDIKYYLNPVTSKLEPVAYESFSNFPITSLSGAYRYSQPDSSQNFADWHSALFSDPVFFRSYIGNLEKFCRKEYLDSFFLGIDPGLKKNLAILYKEFPYKKFNSDVYYDNQSRIRQMLDTPRGLLAYIKDEGHGSGNESGTVSNTLVFQLACIESLPVEVTGVMYGSVKSEAVNIILPAQQPGRSLRYRDYPIEFPPLPADVDTVTVMYRILGATAMKSTVAFRYPHTDNEFISADLSKQKGNAEEKDYLTRQGETFSFSKKSVQISSDLVVPPGMTLFAAEGTTIDLINHAKIISYSRILFDGSEELPVVVTSSDSTSQGILVISAAESDFHGTIFRKQPLQKQSGWHRTAAITFYESPVKISECNFSGFGAEDGLSLIRSSFRIKNCKFEYMANDAVDIDYSSGSITDCSFYACAENAIDLTHSNLRASNLFITRVEGKGINIKAGSSVIGNNINIRQGKIALSAEDESTASLKALQVSAVEYGVVAYENKKLGGHPSVSLTASSVSSSAGDLLRDAKSKITVDGRKQGRVVDDLEKLLKK